MSTTADGREIYVLGKEGWGNREMAVVEDGEVHDLPAAAEYTYSSDETAFPYETLAQAKIIGNTQNLPKGGFFVSYPTLLLLVYH